MVSIVDQTGAGTGTDYGIKQLIIEGTKVPRNFPSTASILDAANSGQLAGARIKISALCQSQVFGLNAGGYVKQTVGTIPYGICNLFAKVQCKAFVESNTYNGGALVFAYGRLTSVNATSIEITTGESSDTVGEDRTVTATYEFYMNRLGL
jgi:hypothetical protein